MLSDHTYNYQDGKVRIEEILNNNCEITEKETIPNDGEFTFDNSYRCWISSIFVDIRNSTYLCTNYEPVKVSKIFRSFTSEVIDILRDNDAFMKEIGIRGDCVYAIYSTPYKDNIWEVANKAFYVNTFMKMYNRLLQKHGLPTIEIGIGVASSHDLIVKAGRKNSGINSKIWIGEAVPLASKFSSIANKDGNGPMIFSPLCYHNFIDHLVECDGDKNPKSWFEYKYDDKYKAYYTANVVKTRFNDWIAKGML